MEELKSIEIKAFVPAKDYELSKQFYQDLGFRLASDHGGIAYFCHDNCSFLLQDFYEPSHASNFMMHLLVEDVDNWYQHVMASGVAEKYTTRVSSISKQPWGMRDFIVIDPSGVLWRIGENIDE